MAPKKRDRRFPISLPIVKEVRLSLWAHTRGKTRTRMAEDILIDRVSAKCNWDEVCIDLKQEAEIRRVSVEDLIKEILIEDNFNETIEVESINWSKLMKNEDPEIEEIED